MRGIRVPFIGRAANHQPALAVLTLQCPFEERSDEHEAFKNTTCFRRSAGRHGACTQTHVRLHGRSGAPFAWNA